jgi:hypothetical protein
MNRWSILLGICLAIQIGLAVVVNLARTDYGAFEPMETILSFNSKTVDSIHIQGDDKRVELTKQEGRWRVSLLNHFQADQDKVEAFLDKLAELKKGWPVATTTAAAKRFKVAEKNFERKIALFRGSENMATLYIGTSPSFQKVHARNRDEESVYAVQFNDYDAGAKPEDWIDKEILKHQASDILRVQLPDFSLSRQDENLFVEGLDENTEETVTEEAERLLRKIAGLGIRTVLGGEATFESNQEQPVFKYTLVLSSGDSEEYVFSKPKDAGHYILKTSYREEYFEVDDWIVDGIKEIDRSKLVRKKMMKKRQQKKK